MLSKIDNDAVCRVGPGTPMGQLMREYWVPALLSSELPQPDSDPVRVLLLGEKLSGLQWLGAALLAASVLLVARERRLGAPPKPRPQQRLGPWRQRSSRAHSRAAVCGC